MTSSMVQSGQGGMKAATSQVSEQDVLLAIDRLRPMIEHHRDEAEQQRYLPEQVVAAMATEGLFNLWAPGEYGGSEVPIPTFMKAVEETSRIDGAAGWTLGILAGGNLLTAYVEPDAGREIYAGGLNQPMPGTVIPNGRLTEVDGGFKASGRWPLVSGSQYGDWIGGAGLIFEGDAPRIGPAGMPELMAFFLRREDCQLLDTWHSVGMRGTGSGDFSVTDAFVPAKFVFPALMGESHVAGAIYAAGPLVLFSMGLTAVYPGIARAAIDAFVEMARSKTPTLSHTGLAVRPTIHAEVARAEARLQSARAYLYEVADELMESLQGGNGVPEALEARRRLACVNAAEASRSVVDAMFALAGATPVYTGHKLERCLRDIHTATQHLLVSPVWWEKTGQFYFGQGLGMP